MDKLAHLLKHWQDHNEEHVANYRTWADRAAGAGEVEVADLLREAADITGQVTALFAKALKGLK